MKRRVTLTVPSTGLESVFHVPELVIDAGFVDDIELAACRLYLAWKGNFPHRRVVLDVVGAPVETKALRSALFSARRRATDAAPGALKGEAK